MEQTFVHLAQTAAWFLLIVFVFALIGVYATIHWIVNLFRRGERSGRKRHFERRKTIVGLGDS